jgi:putative ABC transport system substrate-binding protein
MWRTDPGERGPGDRVTKRRQVLTVLSAVAIAPYAAFAQKVRMVRRVGVLHAYFPGDGNVEEFRKGLHDLGYRNGENLKLEFRWAEGKPERLRALADDLVRSNVELIFTASTPGALAAKGATTTIPIVFVAVGDPVEAGVVSSLARPGGNITGFTHLSVGLVTKTLELIKELIPHLRQVAVLAPISNPTTALKLARIQSGAKALGVKTEIVEIRTGADYEPTFERIRRLKPTALMPLLGVLSTTHKKEIAEFAIRNRLPTIFEQREFVEAGGLLSYGTNFPAMYRHAATHVDKILKGAKPSDLPVEQPTEFELVINMKTAKALGITIPQSILVRADRLIE